MARLTDDRRAEIFDGVMRLVVELGYDKVTMDRVADETKSSKATLYRQWGGKAELFLAAIQSYAPTLESLPDTGTLPGDLHALIDIHAAKPDMGSDLVVAVLQAIRTDPGFADTLRTAFIEPGLAEVKTVLDRAIERGEVDPDCPALPHAVVTFAAPGVLNALLYGRQPDAETVHDYVDAVLLPALGTTN